MFYGPLLPYLLFFTIQQTKANNEKRCVLSCSEGWDKQDGNCYLWPNITKTWEEATEYCEQRGGHLASVKNEEIDKYIRSKVGKIRDKDHGFFNQPTYPWIGGTDQEQEGIWKWSDGSPLNFTKWGNGQPDDWKKSEDCLQFNGERTIDGWNDLECEEHQMFVCSRSICPDISNNKMTTQAPTLLRTLR